VNLTVRSASAWRVTAGLVAGLAGASACPGRAAERQAGPPPATSTARQPVQADSVKLASDQVADSLLVDVHSLDPAILVDLRYATANNFTGAILPGYQAQKALLRREAAQALARVEGRLRSGGLGLRIWDAYRPLRATMAMVATTVEQAVFQRGKIESDDSNAEINASVFDIITVFQKILLRHREEIKMEIAREEISLSDMIKTLKRRIFEETELNILAFFEEMHSKRELVTAFIAVLEIVRTESVKLIQKKTFGEIILKAVTNGTGN